MNSSGTSIRRSWVLPDGLQDEEEAAIENAKIDEQRVLWAHFMSELPSDDLTGDPELWQYWRSQRRAKAQSAQNVISKKIAKVFHVGDKKLLKQQTLKYLIREGIPPELRGKVWYATSGAHDLKVEQEAKGENFTYQYIVDKEIDRLSGIVVEEIEKDLHRTRTLPTPEGLSEEMLAKYEAINERGIASLRRVLKAYAVRNPDIGYCQSMNFVAMMLLFHMDEEQSFWTLVSLIEVILPQDYYSTNLMGVRMDQGVFQRCLEEQMPKMHEHLQEIGVVLDPITIHWFLSIFVGVLPIYGACRVWDCLLFEGDVILFRTGLVLLQLRKRDLMNATDAHGCHTVLKCSAPEQGTMLHTYNLPKPPTKYRSKVKDVRSVSGTTGEHGTEMKETLTAHSKAEDPDDDDDDDDAYVSLQGRPLSGRHTDTSETAEEGSFSSSRERGTSNGPTTEDFTAPHRQMTVSSVSYMMSQTFKHKNSLARERVESLRTEIYAELMKEQTMSQWRMSSVEDQNAGSPWEDRASTIAYSLGAASTSVKGGTLPDDFMKTMNIIDEERPSEHVSPATSIERRHEAMTSWKDSTASDADPLFLAAARGVGGSPDPGGTLGVEDQSKGGRGSPSREGPPSFTGANSSGKSRSNVPDAADSSDSDNSTVPDEGRSASQAAMDHEMSFLSDSNVNSPNSNKSGTGEKDKGSPSGEGEDSAKAAKKRSSTSRKGSWTNVWKSAAEWAGLRPSTGKAEGDSPQSAVGDSVADARAKAKAKSRLEEDL